MSVKATQTVMCPNCDHRWLRKPSEVERAVGKSGALDVKTLLFIYRNRCNMCDVRFSDVNQATIDHIHPKSKGGRNGLHNYQLLCLACNQKKGNKISMTNWEKEVREVLQDLLGYPEPRSEKYKAQYDQSIDTALTAIREASKKQYETVDRFEVIDDTGRAYIKGSIYGTPVRVDLSMQDEGRTLKVFVEQRKSMGDN